MLELLLKNSKRLACYFLILFVVFSCSKKNPIKVIEDCILPEPSIPEQGGPGYDEEVCFSPDGNTIAFTHFSPDTTDKGGIYFANPDGSNYRIFYEGYISPDFSPDGKKIAFSSGLGRAIYTMNLDSTNFKQFVFWKYGAQFQPKWSLDGTKIIFRGTPGGEFEDLWIMNEDGSGLMKFIDTYYAITDFKLSPDRTKIIYSSNDSIYITDADGKNPMFIEKGGYASLSPDNKQIAYHWFKNWSCWGISTKALDGITKIFLVKGVKPVWSWDGKIIFTRRHLWSINPDGTGLKQITFR